MGEATKGDPEARDRELELATNNGGANQVNGTHAAGNPTDKSGTEVEDEGKSKNKKEKKPKEPPPPAVPFYLLFSFADSFDYLLMTVGTLGAIVHGSALPVFFLFFGKLINNLGTNDISAAKDYALYFLYLGIVVAFSSWAEVAGWMHTGERQSARIRSLYLRALMKQEVGFFDKAANSGELVGRVSSDVLLVQDAISEKVGNFLHFMAQFVAGFIVAFTSIWQLTLIFLGVVPLIAACGFVYTVILTGLTSKGQEAYAHAGGIAEQAISQVRTVYSFVGENKAFKAYSKAMESTLSLGIRGGFAKGAGLGALYSILFGAWALEFWYASTLVTQTPPKADGGEALTTMFAAIIGGLSLGQSFPNLTAFSKGRAAAYHIFDMIKRKSAIDSDDLSGEVPSKIVGNIELKDVHFTYPARPDTPIFEGFSLRIDAGKTVALVGASGSGKSTVVGLIERFYDPSAGSVMIDGVDVRQLQLKWLRNQLGLVSQEPALFATSIKENILYGKEGATQEEIEAAAKAANAHNFIMGLPDKYDTQVGERGIQMSGGQKQRIAIARAILKNPAILLLDEATSALDSESEHIVQEALDRIMVGRTTVVIAHRLSTIRNADTIAVVSKGTIVEMGTHDELMSKGEEGAYVQLTRMQEIAKLNDQQMLASNSSLSQMSEPDSRKPSLQQTSALSEGAPSTDGNTKTAGEELPPLQNGSLRRLFGMISADWPSGLLATVGAVLSGSINPVFGLFLSNVIRAYYNPDFDALRSEVNKWCIVFVGLGIFCLPVYIIQHYFFGVMGEKLTKRVRETMFTALMRNEIGWYDRDENSSGAVASRLANDATIVRAAAGDRISAYVQNISTVAIAFTISIVIQWKMALLVISTFPLLIIAAVVEQEFLKGFAGDLAKAHEKASMVASEAVGNIRTVAAFNAEDKVLGLFNARLAEPLQQAVYRGTLAGCVYGGSQMVMYGSFGLGLWYGSTLVPEEADFGDVLRVFLVLVITAFAIAETLSLAPDLAKGGQATRSYFAAIDRLTEIEPDDPNGLKPESIKGQIELKHVKFAYPSRPDVIIFDDFSLKIQAGKTLALVGASGSGKSSVISLIERFYDPISGHVLVDGKDIKQYNLRSLRRHIGMVAQEPVLFATSIRENILYGNEDATEAEIVAAAQAANAHNFISGLPDGYDTETGERGVQLSGGQKQRVAIARAVLKNPAILLLDEATSALDTESERVVQEALDRLMVNRTTIIIAHRLSTIRGADMIAVVQEGKIVEQGSHSNLISRQGGAYRSLVNLQQNTGGAAL